MHTRVTCTIYLVDGLTVPARLQHFFNSGVLVDNTYILQRENRTSIMAGTLITYLYNSPTTRSLAPHITDLLHSRSRDVLLATSLSPTYSEHFENPQSGYRPLGRLNEILHEDIEANFMTPPADFARHEVISIAAHPGDPTTATFYATYIYEKMNPQYHFVFYLVDFSTPRSHTLNRSGHSLRIAHQLSSRSQSPRDYYHHSHSPSSAGSLSFQHHETTVALEDPDYHHTSSHRPGRQTSAYQHSPSPSEFSSDAQGPYACTPEPAGLHYNAISQPYGPLPIDASVLLGFPEQQNLHQLPHVELQTHHFQSPAAELHCPSSEEVRPEQSTSEAEAPRATTNLHSQDNISSVSSLTYLCNSFNITEVTDELTLAAKFIREPKIPLHDMIINHRAMVLVLRALGLIPVQLYNGYEGSRAVRGTTTTADQLLLRFGWSKHSFGHKSKWYAKVLYIVRTKQWHGGPPNSSELHSVKYYL